jgi:hypothetical protein
MKEINSYKTMRFINKPRDMNDYVIKRSCSPFGMGGEKKPYYMEKNVGSYFTPTGKQLKRDNSENLLSKRPENILRLNNSHVEVVERNYLNKSFNSDLFKSTLNYPTKEM